MNITSNQLNFPLILTLVRLVIAPVVVPLLLVYFLPYNLLWLNCLLAVIFVLFSLTDFFDGYLARKYNQVTPLGNMLDPIADKCLIFSTLVALLAVHKIFFVWVIVLIGREFFVMGLRQIALEHGLVVAVSAGGKLKTVLQIILLTIIIINPVQTANTSAWHIGECIMLSATMVVSLFSAGQYYSGLMASLRQK
jgi:CDP-diacylglycerol---glycerol-3-phosphate 3-phosphatidyltransferase